MNKNESKYFSTAVKMNKALIALLEKKDFEYITIKEICETAGVHRSTFYLHYENTSDLLKETTQYITDNFFSYFPKESQNIAQRFQRRALQDLILISPEYLTPYLTFIRDNQRVFKTAILKFGLMGFEDVYKDMFRNVFDPILSRFDLPEREKIYVLRFYLMGITAVVMEWLENNCEDSLDLICKIVIDCVVGKLNINDKNSP